MRRGVLLLLVLAFVLLGADAGAKLRARRKKTAASKKEPPIAFYLADWDSKAATADAAIAKCKAKREKDAQKHPELRSYQDRKSCESHLVTVRGPYVRPPDKYEDHKVYVYRGSDGVWYDANGETSCFVEGTPIATPNGDVAIEALAPGDLVWSWDEAKKARVHGLVERTKRRTTTSLVTIATADGASITATPNHPFFVTKAGTFVDADKLAAGDALFRASGGSEVKRIEKREVAPTAVIDISISPHRNYFAGGVLVHNY